MNYREELIERPDGRVLEVATMGDPAGATVFFHHGTPASARTLAQFTPLLERGEFFFVTLSRPGYGRSSRRGGRDVAAVVDDVRAALEYFGRGAYTSLGWSGGGPHALAAAALDERCQHVVTVASVVPVDVDFDWTAGMGPENLEEFALAMEGGAKYEEAIEVAGAFLAEADKDNVLELMGGLLSEPDRAVLEDDEVRAQFAAATKYAFVDSWRGFYDDDVAFFKPWGFELSTITVLADVFFGDEDLMVPPTHGAWLVEHLEYATEHHFPSEGHLSIFVNHFDELAAALASTE